MENSKGYVESGKYCKKCVYNIYKVENLCSTYPCGMSVCKPLLENEKKMDIENKNINYNNMGNGYIHNIQPVSSIKVSKDKLFKRNSVKVEEVIGMGDQLNSKKAIGVDVGTAFIVSGLYNQNDEIVTKSVRDGFFKLESSKQKKIC